MVKGKWENAKYIFLPREHWIIVKTDRKEDQKYQVPPSHPLYRERLFQIHPEKQVATRKLKNKYLRDL